jgi:hypothetical protein
MRTCSSAAKKCMSPDATAHMPFPFSCHQGYAYGSENFLKFPEIF